MRRHAPGRKAVGVAAASLATTALGVAAGVLVAGPASASSTTPTSTGSVPDTPAARYFVINGTAKAASDHERIGSSAFPNYATGAVDNYYSLAHAHVDNAPFAQGTASPADTGPIGQTAAAGNFQQPQYADARWPGGPDKATYGTKGEPYAFAEAGEYTATAESSAASNGSSTPIAIAAPKGFDERLRRALAAWKSKWENRLTPKAPAPTVTVPGVKVPTPAGTVSTPSVTAGVPTPTPAVTTPSLPVPVPSLPAPATPTRSLSAASGDGSALLESSTQALLDPKTGALVTSGESRLGRVSLGGGQIVVAGIHVTATITNDGAPTEKVAVSVGNASIGGVAVKIDENGVELAGQRQGLPYKQASDALNGALKQAGIQLFMVAPEIEKGSCDQTGSPTGTTSTTTTSTTTTTSSNQATTTTTGSGDQPGTTSPSSCDQTGTTTSTTTTTTTDTTGTTMTTTSCVGTGTTTTTDTGTTTDSTTTTSTTTTTPGGDLPVTPPATDPMAPGTMGPGAETVLATGLHIVFTQPATASGVPAQNVEHVLGEVFLDSLAVPAGPIPSLDLFSPSSSSCVGGSSQSGKKGKTTTAGASSSGGGSSAGGSLAAGSSVASPAGFLQPAAGWSGSGVQPVSSSPGETLQGGPWLLSSLLEKPAWLLVAYLVWQALVIATGASLWRWRRGGAS